MSFYALDFLTSVNSLYRLYRSSTYALAIDDGNCRRLPEYRISPALFAVFLSHVATATLLCHKTKITQRYATPALTNIEGRGLTPLARTHAGMSAVSGGECIDVSVGHSDEKRHEVGAELFE